MIRTLVLLLSLLLLAMPLGAQEGTGEIVLGRRAQLASAVLGEQRAVYIYTPTGYEGRSDRYPVIYLLDADDHFLHTSGVVEFLARTGRMPQAIVVAVPNTRRTRDLTPTTTLDSLQMREGAGGADRFLRFLTEELRPWVDSAYRTHPYRILIGHSFGGLFAIHAMTARPDAFNAYVSISPSLWWNGGAEVAAARRFFAAQPDYRGFLYVTLADEGGNMRTSFDEFVQLATVRKPAKLDFRWKLMEQEDHGTVPHRSTYDALEALFGDFRLPPDLTTLGVAGLDAHAASLAEKYGFVGGTAEAAINLLGYQYLRSGRTAEAVRTFEVNVERFPASANVYDSAGDGYEAAGQLERARRSFAMALERGRKAGNPNVAVYQANLDRVTKKLGR